jgi:adenosylcobinamide kinase/adenosylcobinamide-phosphate guanylyltransferase
MVTLVIGGSGSGKSEYAENLITSRSEGTRIYIATMKPWDEECEKRILRHRQMRAPKGFETVECYRNLKGIHVSEQDGISEVLLECMSNLVSNELFGLGEREEILLTPDETVEEILKGIHWIKGQAVNVTIVTNEVFSDGDDYSSQTNEYRRTLARINQKLAQMADYVTEVIAGIPINIKGN